MKALNRAHEQAERLKAIHEDGMNNLRAAAIEADPKYRRLSPEQREQVLNDLKEHLAAMEKR